ncbi:JmjC domain-containing protein [Rheinheimera sp. A13L]|uniref:cupin-like domain-containing protein n=2 Tax=Rheinheimera TaxID=67575 RepID=UPI00021248E2|nr:JmjC domain-containing protein [Rheinheimera sp. A13L]
MVEKSRFKSFKPCLELSNPSIDRVLQCIGNMEPFIIKGGASSWEAISKWTWEYFRKNLGHFRLQVFRTKNRHDYRYMSIAEYVDYIVNCEESDPYYATAWQFSLAFKQLVNDYQVSESFDCLIKRRIPDDILHSDAKLLLLRWIYMGPKNSGSSMHLDICSTHAWNAVISGKKEWVFFGPEYTAHVYDGEVDSFIPDYDLHPKFRDAIGYHCFQYPGDIIFTPCTHWHQVRNLEAGISITENFVNHSNLNYVRRSMQNSEDLSDEQKVFIQTFLPELFSQKQENE